MNTTPYTVTICPTCKADTALIMELGTYCCAQCGGTGTPGNPGIPDDEPDPYARAAYGALHQDNSIFREFQAECNKRLRLA